MYILTQGTCTLSKPGLHVCMDALLQNLFKPIDLKVDFNQKRKNFKPKIQHSLTTLHHHQKQTNHKRLYIAQNKILLLFTYSNCVKRHREGDFVRSVDGILVFSKNEICITINVWVKKNQIHWFFDCASLWHKMIIIYYLFRKSTRNIHRLVYTC